MLHHHCLFRLFINTALSIQLLIHSLVLCRCSTGGAGPTDGGACEEEQPEQRLHGDASKSTPSDATAAGSAAQSIGGADCLPGGNPDHQEGALGPGAGDATSASHITSFRSPQPRATPQPSRDDAYRAAAGSSAADQLLTQQLLQRTRFAPWKSAGTNERKKFSYKQWKQVCLLTSYRRIMSSWNIHKTSHSISGALLSHPS